MSEEFTYDLSDLFAVQAPLPAMVYYDPLTGDIKGISFVPDEGLASYPHELMAPSEVDKFLTGEWNIGEWIIDNGILVQCVDHCIQLLPSAPMDKLVSDEDIPAQIAIRIEVGRSGKYMGFKLVTASNRSNIVGEKNVLDFMVTVKDQPDMVLADIHVNVTELSAKRSVAWFLGKELGTDIDIYTIRHSPVRYVIDEVEYVRPVLPIPKYGFEDVRKLERPPGDDLPPCLLVTRSENKLSVTVHKGGGAIYNRTVSRLLIALCAPGDPHRLLKAYFVDPVEIEDGVELIIPDELLRTKFEVYNQLLYDASYYVDAINH